MTALQTPSAIVCQAPTAVQQLVAELRAFEIEAPLNHIFTPGLYTREIFLPKGSLSVSKLHKTEHPFVISAGAVSVLMPDGAIERIQAPHTGVTKPGTQRVIFAREDTIWSTFHPTHETDLKVIESAIIDPGHSAMPIHPDALRRLCHAD